MNEADAVFPVSIVADSGVFWDSLEPGQTKRVAKVHNHNTRDIVTSMALIGGRGWILKGLLCHKFTLSDHVLLTFRLRRCDTQIWMDSEPPEV
jgi:hypothetical protein